MILFSFACFAQVLSQLLISARNLSHLSIIHKLTGIQQNRTPREVLNTKSAKLLGQNAMHPGISHRRKIGLGTEEESAEEVGNLNNHHNGPLDGISVLDRAKSQPCCCYLFKVEEGWQPEKVDRAENREGLKCLLFSRWLIQDLDLTLEKLKIDFLWVNLDEQTEMHPKYWI